MSDLINKRKPTIFDDAMQFIEITKQFKSIHDSQIDKNATTNQVHDETINQPPQLISYVF